MGDVLRRRLNLDGSQQWEFPSFPIHVDSQQMVKETHGFSTDLEDL